MPKQEAYRVRVICEGPGCGKNVRIKAVPYKKFGPYCGECRKKYFYNICGCGTWIHVRSTGGTEKVKCNACKKKIHKVKVKKQHYRSERDNVSPEKMVPWTFTSTSEFIVPGAGDHFGLVMPAL